MSNNASELNRALNDANQNMPCGPGSPMDEYRKALEINPKLSSARENFDSAQKSKRN